MQFYIKAKLSENISETPEGYLLCKNVPLTHTGELQYAKGEHPFDEVDVLTVSREKAEITSPKTMASFMGKPVTIEHPGDNETKDGFVNPDSWQKLTHGTIVNVRESDEKIEVNGKLEDAIIGDLLITTANAIQSVKDGLREVSLGYDAAWELVKDNYAHHRNIIGNHVALVKNGRAGENFSIKDSGEKMKIDQVKTLFKKLTGKSFDEAMAEEKKETEKTKDAPEVAAMKQQVVDLQAKIADAEKPKEEVKKEESKDAPMGDDKLDQIIALLTKMCPADEQAVDADEVDEVMATDSEEDDAVEDSYKAADAEMVEGLAEILSPGIEMTKDVKTKALQAAYKTTDGKKIIEVLTGGKALDSVKDQDVLFIAAAQAMKSKRSTKLSVVGSRASAMDAFPSLKTGTVTPESINEANEKHYNKTK